MNKYKYLIGLIIILFAVGLWWWQNNYPGAQVTTISDLNQNKVEPGLIKIDGYVVKKLIADNQIIISQVNEIPSSDAILKDTNLLITTDNPDKYNVGYKYTFELKLEGYDSRGQPIYHLE